MQSCEVNGCFSDLFRVQASVASFSLYSSTNLYSLAFAGDTNIAIKHKNLTSMTTTLNQELTKIYDWYSANKLTLSNDKTNAILFSNSKMHSLAVLKSISIFPTQGILSKEQNQENLFAVRSMA